MVLDMDSRRHEALVELNKHHDPFLGHFPIESSGQIFMHCLPETLPPYGLPADYDMELNRMPTLETLMSLCKNWRETVFSTPKLWQTLFAHRPEDIPDIDRYLDRCRGLPLTLDVVLYEKFWSLAQCHQAMEAICHHASWWRTVNLRAPNALIASITKHTSTLANGLPNLLDISLVGLQGYYSATRYSRGPLTIGSQTIPTAAPTEISMKNAVISKTTFDFKNLTFLTLDDTPINHFEDIFILLMSPRLEVIYAKLYGSDTPRSQPNDVATPSRITLSSLTHLELTIYDTGNQNIFDVATLPSLILFHCSSLHPAQGDQYRALYDLFIRSRCPLLSLDLSLACTEDQLLQLLRLTPNLRELKIISNRLTSHFFHYMGETALPTSPTAGKTTFLPELNTFRFNADQMDRHPFDISLLRSIVRTPSPAQRLLWRPILEITVVWDTDFGRLSESDELVILGLLNDGIEISLPVDGLESEDVIESYERLHCAREMLREDAAQFTATGDIL